MAAADRRLLVWDYQQDWLRFNCTRVETVDALARVLGDHADGAIRISFKAGTLSKPAFGVFAQLAQAWGKIEPARIVVEELSWVTDPGKAPRGWLELVTGGLKYGINLTSITQRPADADKTSLSQADVVQCFMVDRKADQKYMADELGIDVDQIAALAPLEFVRKDKRTRKVTAGKLSF